MLRRWMVVIILLSLCRQGEAFCCADWYLRGTAGVNFSSSPSIPEINVVIKTGYALGGSIGYRFSHFFRLEGELMYRHNPLDYHGVGDEYYEGSDSTLAFMGNCLVDLPFSWIFDPYIGVGLGGYRAWLDCSIPELSTYFGNSAIVGCRSTRFAYQVIAGLQMLRFWDFKAGIEYHFLGAFQTSFYNHTVALTCRYTF